MQLTAGPFAALHFRDFRLFWVGLLVSNIGTWMQMTAVNWLLYELTDSALQLGLNGLFRAIPVICLGLFSGTVADRYDRRRLLLMTQMAASALALPLGTLTVSGQIQPWHIYAFTVISATVNSLDGPARQAFFPSLVPATALPSAIALNSLLWKGTSLLGPALAGIAISTVGTGGVFYINAASFLGVVLALCFIKSSPARIGHHSGFLMQIHEGVSFVVSQKVILGVMIMEAASSVFGLDQAMLTIFARDVLQVGATGLGLLQSARGLGAIIGSGLFMGMHQLGPQGIILFFSSLLYGLSFALFGLSYSFPASLSLLLFVGATDTVWAAARNTVLQLRTPEGMRGRVMGVFNLSNRGLHPLGQAETGIVVPLVGARVATFCGGMLVAMTTLLTVWKVRSLWNFRLNSHSHEP